jgi:hypothetical protein
MSASPVLFQGDTTTKGGEVMDKIVMSVTQTDTGFSDYIAVEDDGHKIASTTVNMDASGNFSTSPIGSDNLIITGKMNAGQTAIIGSFSMRGGHGGVTGKVELDMVPEVNDTIPTTGTITQYVGKEVNSKGVVDPVDIEVFNNSGTLTGDVEVHDYNNNLIPLSFNISSTGTISFFFTLQDQTDIVQGKLSANGKLFTGSFITINNDGTNSFGAFRGVEAS